MKRRQAGPSGLLLLMVPAVLVVLAVSLFLVVFAGEPSYEVIDNSLYQNVRTIRVYTQDKSDEALIEINDRLIAEYTDDGSQQYLIVTYYDDRGVAVRATERSRQVQETRPAEPGTITIGEGPLPSLEEMEELQALMDHLIAGYRTAEPGMYSELRRYQTGETLKMY